MPNHQNEVTRFLKPKGNLLNDNDCGVDQLGYLVYAKALARLLHECRPPITVGIFAPWGSGKTFLLKHVQGLLRKYQRQHQYDVVEVAKIRERITRRGNNEGRDSIEDEISQHRSSQKVKNKTSKNNRSRCCKCTVFTLLVVFLILFLVCLVYTIANPNIWSVSLDPKPISTPDVNVTRLKPSGRIAPVEGLEITTSSSTAGKLLATTTAPVDDFSFVAGNIRIYLILALVILTTLVFSVFCCCVSDTNSKCWSRFQKHSSLIFYAAFTRLPSVSGSSSDDWIEADDPYLVMNLNDEDAVIKPLDETNLKRFGMSEKDVHKMPIRYIFVNYHAWQYAGSDTLWAGIATNLCESIEKEFGAVTARLFRMMQVERPSKSGPIKGGLLKKDDPLAIYVRLRFDMNDASLTSVAARFERVTKIVQEYGVVTHCIKVWEDSEISWWFVRFSSDKEASYAEKALKLSRFVVQRGRPQEACANGNGSNRRNANTSNNIEMTVMEDTRHNMRDVGRPEEALLPPKNDVGSRSCLCCVPCLVCRFCRHLRRHPKTVCCGCPYVGCCLLFAVAALLLPVAIMILASDLELGVIKGPRAIPIEVQIFSWLPATVGALIIAVRFCWAMCHSQTERIRKAMAGSSGTMATGLGFMNDVKHEVMMMTQLINCARFTHRIDYKVVITIDDLDRLPYDKVKSVLEAVSILLSDRSSPFVCLVAVDSRVAVKCIEQEMGEVLLKANLTGHEYLKKIINLPFCLPELADRGKSKYVGGLMDSADKTVLTIETEAPSPSGEEDEDVRVTATDHIDGEDDLARNSVPNRTNDIPPNDIQTDENDGQENGSGLSTRVILQDDIDNFLGACRRYLQQNKFVRRHMLGNPRNIKRIFNVLSLTTRMMQSLNDQVNRRNLLALHSQPRDPNQPLVPSDAGPRTPFDFDLTDDDMVSQRAEELVKWIILTDQWPYRVSYILHMMKEKRSDIGEHSKLCSIYSDHVQSEITADDNMLALDEDPAVFVSLLESSHSLTKERVSHLFPYTLNLDQSIRNGISRKRSKPTDDNTTAPTSSADA